MVFEYDQDAFRHHQVLALRRRVISGEQMRKFEGYITEILESFGLEPGTTGTEETPQRFLQGLFEATEGYDGDPKLPKVFERPGREEPDSCLSQVIEGPIPFYALCEHHAFPFYGNAYIGYVPHEHIVGISKLTRLVRLFAKRFTVQERLAQQIVDAFEAMLMPYGVAVYLEAHHLCMEMRGVRESTSLTRTTVWRGTYGQNSSLRVEFLLACGADT